MEVSGSRAGAFGDGPEVMCEMLKAIGFGEEGWACAIEPKMNQNHVRVPKVGWGWSAVRRGSFSLLPSRLFGSQRARSGHREFEPLPSDG